MIDNDGRRLHFGPGPAVVIVFSDISYNPNVERGNKSQRHLAGING